MQRRRFCLGAVAGAAGVSGLAWADTALPVPPGDRMAFRILRNGAPIGTHELTFTQDGSDLAVAIKVALDVSMLGIHVFHYTLQATERWSGGVFQSLDSRINHNGEMKEVHVKRVPADGYDVVGLNLSDPSKNFPEYTAPPGSLPLTYWNKAWLAANVINIETAHSYPATVNSPGWNNVPNAEGGTILAQRFDVTGKLHLSVWYDQQAQWSSLAFSINGDELYEKIVSPRVSLRVILGDQLSLALLPDLSPDDTVLMAEVMGECTYVPHHPQKIVLVLSAMRHFAAELRARGVRLRYVRLDDPDNTGTLTGEVERAVRETGAARVIVTAPAEYRVREDASRWPGVEIHEDERFCAPPGFFARWARGKTSLRMEFFYREMRRLHGILMDGDQPAGGAWNYDSENRKKLPATVKPPAPQRIAPDEVTRDVIDLVAARFPNHYGSVNGFDYPVTRADAQAGFEDFLTHRLASFGDWQDAMAADTPYLFHSLVSAPLNLGLLEPLELCRAAEAAYRAGQAPLNAVEGFVRQILGWREFVRGIYGREMPAYATRNVLGAIRKLPDFYWTGKTAMRCMADAIGQTMKYAYAHHIQRLMITGNFALLAGLHPDAVDEWYLAVYADAYEWVEMPNVRGMALYADGGIVGSKPYAASGAYINRMSDYCGTCSYDVKDATGPRACPFNALYWDFIARHAPQFAGNPRMAMPVRSWANMAPARQSALRTKAADILCDIEQGSGP